MVFVLFWSKCSINVLSLKTTILFDYYIVKMTLYTSKNGGDVQRKNVVNNVDKSSLWAPW